MLWKNDYNDVPDFPPRRGSGAKAGVLALVSRLSSPCHIFWLIELASELNSAALCWIQFWNSVRGRGCGLSSRKGFCLDVFYCTNQIPQTSDTGAKKNQDCQQFLREEP